MLTHDGIFVIDDKNQLRESKNKFYNGCGV